MKIKKIQTLAIFLSISVLFCSCSSIQNVQNETASDSETLSAASESVTESSAETTDIPMDVSPITFTLFINDTKNEISFDTPVAAEITKLTGVTLEISHASEDSDLDVMLTSGNLPDLIYAGERTEELIKSGAIIPLDGYAEDIGKNFPGFYGENADMLRSDDGKLYTFGTGGSSPYRLTANGTFQVRYEVLEEVGYPEIKTIGQLGDCLRKYKEKHPQSTGLLLCGSPRQQWLDTVSARVNYVLGYPDDGEFLVDNDTGEAVYKWIDPRTKEFIKWLNTLYNEGLLDKQSFSLKHDAYLDKLINGTPAAAADYFTDYASVEEGAAADRRYCPLPVALNEDSAAAFPAEYTAAPCNGIGITTSCQSPERAFSFMDWLCSDKAQKLLNYGTEEIAGNRDITEENYSAETGVGLYAEPFPMRSPTEKTSDGKFYSYAARKYTALFTDAEKNAAAAYGIDLFSELFPQESDVPKINRTLISDMDIPPLSETAILLETLETYVKTEVPNAIKAPTDEFDEKWDEITDWCKKNGAERLGELMTQAVREDIGI